MNLLQVLKCYQKWEDLPDRLQIIIDPRDIAQYEGLKFDAAILDAYDAVTHRINHIQQAVADFFADHVYDVWPSLAYRVYRLVNPDIRCSCDDFGPGAPFMRIVRNIWK